VRVALTGVATAGVAFATGSGLAALLLGLACVAWGVGRAVAVLIVTGYQEVTDLTARRLARAARHYADELLDARTHDPFRGAADALHRARGRGVTDQPAIDRAMTSIEAVDAALRETSTARRVGRRENEASLFGGVASEHRGAIEVTRLYGDPLTLPGWLRPGPRDALLRVGRVLDDVRLLHSMQLEWSVMLLTLWARAILVGLSPLLGAVAFAPLPLDDGFEFATVPWLLAAGWAAGCALIAPRTARLVLSRTDAGHAARRVLLAVEVPLACVTAVLFPAWTVVVFAAGWTNWWQRQWNDPQAKAEFSWSRLGIFLAVVVSTQVAGLVLHGVGAGGALIEVLAALAAIAVVGGSYGAMWPVSAAVLVQIVGGALFKRRDAIRSVGRRLDGPIDDLRAAARAIEVAEPGNEGARADADALRGVARQLQLREAVADRSRRRTPLDVEALLESALRDGGTMQESPVGERMVADAAGAGEAEPVTLALPSISPESLRTARFASRSYARTVKQLVVRCAMEARTHGTGVLQTILRPEGEELVLRIANRPAPSPSTGRRGRGRGRRELVGLAESLPGGELRTHELLDSRFVGERGTYEVFAVEVAFDRTALRAGDRDLARPGNRKIAGDDGDGAR